MQKAILPPDHFCDLLVRLPPGLDLDQLALDTNAIERRREICGAEACSTSPWHAAAAAFR